MKKQILSEQFRRMQKLAGILTESQLEETEVKDAASIIKVIDAKLKAKNLKGMPSTNLQNPADDIKNKEVDYVTITYKADAGDVVSVYIKDTSENEVLAKAIETEFGGKFFTGNANGTVLGVSQIPAKSIE
jgi:alanyl-tRNA synthetase